MSLVHWSKRGHADTPKSKTNGDMETNAQKGSTKGKYLQKKQKQKNLEHITEPIEGAIKLL